MSSIGAVLALALLLFELVMIVRAVLDWVAVPAYGGGRSVRARELTHLVTEPVIAPVRRLVRPVRLGSVSFDLAFTLVFVAVLILRSIALSF
jgi:YggT family protein